jgi:hypothetical protein
MKACWTLFWIGLIHFWLGIHMGNQLVQWVGIFLGSGALIVALCIMMINYLHGKYTS